MYSTTVAGAAVPVWDRALMNAVTAHSTPGGESSRLRIGVLNPEGQLYREIFGGDLAEYAELLERMALLERVRADPACAGLRVMVGGHPFGIDPALWRTLGADGTAADAEQAVALAEQWLAGPPSAP